MACLLQYIPEALKNLAESLIGYTFFLWKQPKVVLNEVLIHLLPLKVRELGVWQRLKHNIVFPQSLTMPNINFSKGTLWHLFEGGTCLDIQ